MTQDQIIQWAREAGFDAEDGEITAPRATINSDPMDVSKIVTKLCSIVRSAALEAEADLIDSNGIDGIPIQGDDIVADYLRGRSRALKVIA